MLKKDKIEKAKQLQELVANNRSFVFTDYRGLKVSEMTKLRKLLNEKEGYYKVVKNRIFKRILSDLEIKIEDDEIFSLPLGIVFCKGEDYILPIKTVADFTKEHNRLEIKLGYIDGQVYDKEDIIKMSKLPAKEVLFGMLVAGLKAPVSRFAGSLRSIFSKLVFALREVEKKGNKE